MNMRSLLGALLALLALAGCAGDPDLANATEALEEGAPLEIDRARWERAAAGCEDAPATIAGLRACAGEPLLGALLDAEGRVVCVDSMSLLRAEVRVPTSGRLPDPTPTPILPLGHRADPTPTPMVGE